jgi:hypothetical protein
MIAKARKHFNDNYYNENYQYLKNQVTNTYYNAPKFRLAETPVFLPEDFKAKLLEGCEDAFRTICAPDFKEKTEGSLVQRVPNENAHTHFMQIDFGVCKDKNGKLSPQMIEIQGFPSLYAFQVGLADAFKRNFSFPVKTKWTTFFNGLNEKEYLQLLKEVIVSNHKPENVVLLEIEPEKQSTNIDFYATALYLGIRVVCLTELKKEGKKLFYINGYKEKVQIHRIYNRVIFDELERRTDLKFEFNFQDEVDVEWAGHPNWFFRISKYTLPLIKSKYVPETFFLHELTEIPSDLENYVLKPLFSFAGMGVKINVTPEDIAAITDRENYILQRKVHYADIIPTPDGPAKCEIRMMVLWRDGDERPMVVNNICRLSKGEMIGVRYNKDKTWVGGTVCFMDVTPSASLAE